MQRLKEAGELMNSSYDYGTFPLIGSIILSSLIFAACSSVHVSSEKSPGADLSRYKTYSWAPKMEKASPDPILDQHIRVSIDNSLQKNGFTYRPIKANPDFLIRYSVASERKTVIEPDTVGRTYDTPYWNGYRAIPPTVETYRQGSLVVDFIDTRSNVPFWRGIAGAEIHGRSEVIDTLTEASQKIVTAYRKDEALLNKS
jgi:hypothetical protein